MAGRTQETRDHPSVLVVGGGPTGLTAANLLGRYGVRTLLIEKNGATSDEAKAISLDDESLRTLQIADLDSAIYPIIVPGTGTRYYSSSGKPLVHARGPAHSRFGHSFKNPFAQPDLERLMHAALTRFDDVESRFDTELLDLADEGDSVLATIRGADGTERVRTDYVLGCDGGRSTVRDLLGIAMSGRSFPDLWLVADTLGDTRSERYGMHVGDPSRPHVIVAGRGGRCRYEFKLEQGEAVAGPNPPFELVQRLVGRYRDLQPEQLERSVVYGFHALVADQMSAGRCFLLGDAAHMMPPFAGQGLNSGVRDAANLSWKLAHVVQGRSKPTLLATYESERREHVRATVDLSVRLGNVVMTSSRVRATVRDLVVGLATRVPWTRHYLEEMRYRPMHPVTNGFVVHATTPQGQALVGRALEQPLVLRSPHTTPTRLDDVLGPGMAVLGVEVTEEDWALLDQSSLGPQVPVKIDVVLDDCAPVARRGRVAVADADTRLQSTYAPLRGQFVLVRPDRLVAAVLAASEVEQVAARLSAFLTSVPPHPDAGSSDQAVDPGPAPRRVPALVPGSRPSPALPFPSHERLS
jgi:3-(3-hydroxy-phenyl)propionate hydroxylase